MPIATASDLLLLDPVTASCGVGLVGGANVVIGPGGPVVDVVASGVTGVTVVDVEPNGVIGVSDVVVVGCVGVVTGMVVVGAIVVVGATVVGVVSVVLVVGGGGGGVQFVSVACACADPPPSVESHESLACTVWVPGLKLSDIVSVACAPLNVKSRCIGLSSSTVTDSCAVVDASAKA